jgi:hypothetical protein
LQPSRHNSDPKSLRNSDRNGHRNEKRANRRKKEAEEGHTAKSRTFFKHVQLADVAEVPIDLEALPVAKGGYTARRFIRNEVDLEKQHTIKDLNDQGFTVFEWDGRYDCNITPSFSLLTCYLLLFSFSETLALLLIPMATYLLFLQVCQLTQPIKLQLLLFLKNSRQ